MNTFSTKLHAFDLSFYEINALEYDPLKDIIDFWNQYDIKSFRESMMLVLNLRERSAEKKNLDGFKEEVFLLALTRLILAYYIAHDKGLGFEKLDPLRFQNYEINKKLLKTSKLIYKFFNRIAIKPKNKL